LVGTHADSIKCSKNPISEELSSTDADHLIGKILNEFGCIFNIHPEIFLMDATSASSASMRAFKAAITEFKHETVEVKIPNLDSFGTAKEINLSTFFRSYHA
jgi:hypothetical protein